MASPAKSYELIVRGGKKKSRNIVDAIMGRGKDLVRPNEQKNSGSRSKDIAGRKGGDKKT